MKVDAFTRRSLWCIAMLPVVCVLWLIPQPGWTSDGNDVRSRRKADDSIKEEAHDDVRPTQNAATDSADSKTLRSHAEKESIALKLVKDHLPQLRPILRNLRQGHPQAYQKALADLNKSAQRLESAKRRGTVLFKIELAVLQAKTEVDLLTAKLKVRDDSSDRKQLRKAIADLNHAELQQAEYNVQAAQNRLSQIEKQLQAAQRRLEEKQTQPDQQIEKSFRKSLRKAGRDETPVQ